MEPLWSPVGATGGNRWQIGSAPKPPRQAKTVAVGCDQLRFRAHGKEGISGSSPEEALQKACTAADYRADPVAPSSTCGGYGALYGAFSSKTRSVARRVIGPRRVSAPANGPVVNHARIDRERRVVVT